MRRVAITTAVAAALVALPALAQARPDQPGRPDGAGPKGEQPKGGPSKGKSKGKGRCARPHRKAFVAKGTFVKFVASEATDDAATAGDLTVTLDRGNRHARPLLGERTVSTVGARVSFRGVTDTGDGTVGFEDVLATDRVMLIGKVVRPKRGCGDAEATVAVRKVKVVRRAPAQPAPAVPSDD